MRMYGTVRVSKCIGHQNGQEMAEKVLLDKNHESGLVVHSLKSDKALSKWYKSYQVYKSN